MVVVTFRAAIVPEVAIETRRHQVGTKLALSRQQVLVLESAGSARPLAKLIELCGRSDRTKFRNDVLKPLLQTGWLEMTIPDKPRSSKQRYRSTPAGLKALEEASQQDGDSRGAK